MSHGSVAALRRRHHPGVGGGAGAGGDSDAWDDRDDGANAERVARVAVVEVTVQAQTEAARVAAGVTIARR